MQHNHGNPTLTQNLTKGISIVLELCIFGESLFIQIKKKHSDFLGELLSTFNGKGFHCFLDPPPLKQTFKNLYTSHKTPFISQPSFTPHLSVL